MFAKIDLILDTLKSITILYKFETLHLYIIHCFCYILEITIYKNILFNNLLFKLEISFAFLKKIFKVTKILNNIKN